MACLRLRFTNMIRADASQAVEEAQWTARIAAGKTAETFAHVLLQVLSLNGRRDGGSVGG